MVFSVTSCFSNKLDGSDCNDQRKALLTPFKQLDGLSNNVLQYQADFAERIAEYGMQLDFNFVISENQPSAGTDLSDPKIKAKFPANAKRFNSGNLLQEPSLATLKMVIEARDYFRFVGSNIQDDPTDPSSTEARAIISYQNRQMLYSLLTASWSNDMIMNMSKYLEVHGRDGVVFYYCFLQHFIGTTTKDIIEATLLLDPDKMQLHLFDGIATSYTSFIHCPFHKVQKSNHEISMHIYIHTFHGCSNCSNDEFTPYIYQVYTEWCSGEPAKSWSILELLDNLDKEYNRIRVLGHWEIGKNAEILALTTQIALQSMQLATFTTSMTLLSVAPTAFRTPAAVVSPSSRKDLQKPPNPPAAGIPEIVKFKGKTGNGVVNVLPPLEVAIGTLLTLLQSIKLAIQPFEHLPPWPMQISPPPMTLTWLTRI